MAALYGRIYLYDYPYSILCYGAIQSALAGVGLHGFVLWNLTESREYILNAENGSFKIWGVLVWFLVDFLMGILLLVCTLCHWKSLVFKIWVLVNWMTIIFLDYYCFSCFNLFSESRFLNVYGWFLVTYTGLRFCSNVSVWNYSRLRDVLGPKVYFQLDNNFVLTLNCNEIIPKYDAEKGIVDKKENDNSPFFVNQKFAIIRQ